MRRRISDGGQAQLLASPNTIDQCRRRFNQPKPILKYQVFLFGQPPSAHGLKCFNGVRHELPFWLLECDQERRVCGDGTSALAILRKRHQPSLKPSIILQGLMKDQSPKRIGEILIHRRNHRGIQRPTNIMPLDDSTAL